MVSTATLTRFLFYHTARRLSRWMTKKPPRRKSAGRGTSLLWIGASEKDETGKKSDVCANGASEAVRFRSPWSFAALPHPPKLDNLVSGTTRGAAKWSEVFRKSCRRHTSRAKRTSHPQDASRSAKAEHFVEKSTLARAFFLACATEKDARKNVMLNPFFFKWNISHTLNVKYSLYGNVKYSAGAECEMKFAHVRVANISHLRSKYFTAQLFHLPEGQISLKKPRESEVFSGWGTRIRT